MSANAGSISVDVGIDLSAFNRGMQSLQSGLQRTTSELSQMGSEIRDSVQRPLSSMQSSISDTTRRFSEATNESRRFTDSVRQTGQAGQGMQQVAGAVENVQKEMLKASYSADGTAQKINELGTDLRQLTAIKIDVLNREFEQMARESGQAENSVEMLARKLEMQRGVMGTLDGTIKAHEKALDRLKAVYGENSREVMEHKQKLLDLKGTYSQLDNQIHQTQNQVNKGFDFSGITGGLRSVTEGVGEATGSFGGLGAVITKSPLLIAGAAFAGVGIAAGKMAIDNDNAQAQIQASLGATKAEAEHLTGAAREVWRDGFGENMTQVSGDLITVKKNMKEIPVEKLGEMTKNGEILAQTFGVEVTESTRAANSLMNAFGISGRQAFDTITVGYQKGLDYSDDFLDTIREYSPLFKNAGFSVDEMMNILIAGSEQGAFNLDYVADSVKEFNIRVKDGSKGVKEAFDELGGNAKKTWNLYNEGKATSKEVMTAVIQDLKAQDDAVKQNQLGVALFGTKWEDLEANVMLALDPTVAKLGEVEGATNKAGDAVKNTLGGSIKELGRETSTFFQPLTDLIQKGIDGAKDLAKNHNEAMNSMKENSKPVVEMFDKNLPEGIIKSAEGFTKLNSEGQLKLQELYASSSAITQAQRDDLAAKFDGMKNDAVAKLQERQSTETTLEQNFLKSKWDMSQEEKNQRLQALSEKHKGEIESLNGKNAQAKYLLDLAMKDENGMSSQHYSSLKGLMDEYYSSSLSNMKASDGEKLSLKDQYNAFMHNKEVDGASKLIKVAEDTKTKNVAVAKAMYDDKLREIERGVREGTIKSEQEKNDKIRIAKEEYDGIVNSEKDKVERVKSLNSDMASSTKATVSDLKNGTTSDFRTMSNEVPPLVAAMKNNALAQFEALARESKAKAEGTNTQTVGEFNSMSRTLGGMTIESPRINPPQIPQVNATSFTQDVGGQAVSLPRFNVSWFRPAFATGGIVTGPTEALIGEAGDEAVVPLSNKSKMKPFANAVASMMTDKKSSDSTGKNSGQTVINIESMIIREEADIKKLADELDKRRRFAERAGGNFVYA
ncbi:phage tail tape measure protein [Bacillus thuringiensis]|uniref:phage tail tape measure protein n=3 Tax=Bacillus cereus group TaxID=86661 RepID=UPI000CD90235|nr:phage tail tape measure protein [Bacillus thuringiensis]MEC3417068.1 phage tail tape measure protein [Bacillus cereus]MEC3596972.1 phage tail tape measure protein [Bacillus thuringiensis]MED1836160.1 phage tail tape measure protein [Bacillus thuringiensis]MED2670223.1 phage tail tape measure protein [Bacillus thuringiensis]MED2694160.1 phage tail tape measure protein [Bacillus thuringiensis]